MKNVISFLRNVGTVAVAAALVFALPAAVFGQDVNRPELEDNQAAVNFINYVGPYTRIDTVEQIRAIGYGLGLAVRDGADAAGTDSRYFVIHSVSPVDGAKLDADIFGLGIDVGVDHIRNLRLIIQGFLEGAYEYTAEDAALLSTYVTIYNAVFRGDWDSWTTRYKGPVVENLTTDKAGLSIRFDEWPGQTLMTIPLGTGESGDLSAIETSALTSPEVIDQMRREGGGIEDRQGMVDVKEREAERASQSAALQREAIRQEDANIARDRASTEAERRRIEQDQAAGRITPEEAARQLAANEQRGAELAQREAAQEAARQEAAATEARAEQKTAEAQQERADIARDQQAAIDNAATQTLASATTPAAGAAQGGATPASAANPAAAANILGVSLLSKSSPLGRLVKLNPASGKVEQLSTINTVNGRTIVASGNRIFAVAGAKTGSGAIRLVELSPDTLEMVKQGEDDIHPQSLLWSGGADLYAVVVEGGKNYLARFNAGLEKQSRTEGEVHPYATCVLQGGNLLTQKADGSPLILNAQSLK